MNKKGVVRIPDLAQKIEAKLPQNFIITDEEEYKVLSRTISEIVDEHNMEDYDKGMLLDRIRDDLYGAQKKDHRNDQIVKLLSDSIGTEIPDFDDDDDTSMDVMEDGMEYDDIEDIRNKSMDDLISSADQPNVDDPVKMYLKEIGKVELLNAEEEITLAEKIENGNECKNRIYELEKKLKKPDSPEAKEELIVEYEKLKLETQEAIEIGEASKKRLAEGNLRLVVSIAKRYVGRGMQFLDLIQEGNLGLIKAVEKFDHTKGYKFSTYATWWIRQAITRAIADQARTIRIPVHMVETINKLLRTQRTLLQELGREPSQEEIAKEMKMSVEKVAEIQKISQEPVSLETPIGEEEDSHLGDFIQDENVPMPAEAATQTLLKEQLMDVLKTLTEREQKVLRLRFGLDDGKARTLEEVGRVFDVTRERIRQIEAKALRKLRHPSRSRKLKDFLE